MKLSHPLALALFITVMCNATNQFTFQAIEDYHNKPQPHSYIDYQSFESLSKHANGLFTTEQYEEAIAFYKQAAALNPTCAQVFFNLGQALYYAKKYSEALYAYKKTIQYKVDHHRAYAQVGKLMIDVKQPNDAIEPLKQALLLEPNNPDVRLLLARVYNDKHLFNQSIAVVTEGLKLEPGHINLKFELGNIYNLVNRLDESMAIYKELDRQLPNNPSILYNIGFTYKKIGDMEQALPYYNRTLELVPDHSEALFSRGLAYLVMGEFEQGWYGYEWRYSRPSQGSLRTYPEPRWDGSDLQGKTVLVHAEQGLGDTFQFIRYAKLIKEKNGTLIVAVQKPLVTLMKRCKYIDQVISLDDTPPHFDVHSPMLSLPYILKTRIDTIPCEIPYLFADEKLVADWKQKLSTDKNFKIGICWQGNDSYATPALRATVAQKSVHPREFAPICQVPGVSVYSLQKTTGTDQLSDLPDNMRIITFDGDFDQTNGRFMDTAAVIKNLDLVITVDTSISHLSSGLAVPTWIMLPNPADWRWMINRDDSPWYPNITRLFKQPTPGDWESMIKEVAVELKKHIGKK
ncbi:MAG TPA: tetratricopeptide repeat protein [Candidatus Babeliales bacterium]|jgi:tetratricopeptide (TPR) repeat protein|nr:tetratricopeptide repeat protein [Candidatus Babeliales bacterium]